MCVCVLFRQRLSVPALVAHSFLFFFLFPRNPFWLSGIFIVLVFLLPPQASSWSLIWLCTTPLSLEYLHAASRRVFLTHRLDHVMTMFQCCFVSFVTCRGFTETCVYSWRFYLIEMWSAKLRLSCDSATCRVMSLRWLDTCLSPFVDSTRVLYASFCFRFLCHSFFLLPGQDQKKCYNGFIGHVKKKKVHYFFKNLFLLVKHWFWCLFVLTVHLFIYSVDRSEKLHLRCSIQSIRVQIHTLHNCVD